MTTLELTRPSIAKPYHSAENKRKRQEGRRRYLDRQRALFIEQYENYVRSGLTDIEIADRFGCQLVSLRVRLRRYGVAPQLEGRRRYLERQRALFIEQYEGYVQSGLTDIEIAERFHCQPRTLRARLRSYGVEPRPSGPAPKTTDHLRSPEAYKRAQESRDRRNAANREAFLEDYHHFVSFGMSDQEVADRLGFKLDTLLTRLRRYGVERQETQTERESREAVDQLAASGAPFTLLDVPRKLDRTVACYYLRRLRKLGQIRSVGWKRAPENNSKLMIWVGVEEAVSA